MNLFYEIEDVYYSIYKIELIKERLILHFRDSKCIELGTDELDTHTVFCERYNQVYHIPIPVFNSKTWGVFVKMLFERAQLVC